MSDITVNCYRSGVITQTYAISNTDNMADGDYTCIVTVHTVASPESFAFSLPATGTLTFKVVFTISK